MVIRSDGSREWRLAAMPPQHPFPGLTPPGHADRDPAWWRDGRFLAVTRSLAKWPEKMTLPAPGQAIWVINADTWHGEQVPGSEDGFSLYVVK